MREREGHRKNKERKNKNTKSAVILSYICMYYTICVQIYNKYSNNIKTKTKEKTHTPKTTTHREKDKKNKKKNNTNNSVWSKRKLFKREQIKTK